HVLLGVVEHSESVAAILPRPSQEGRKTIDDVLFATLQQLQLPPAVVQVGIFAHAGRGGDKTVDQRQGGGALDDVLEHPAGHESDQTQLVQVGEGILEVGEQGLGELLQQDRVVALEGGED